MPLTPKEFKQRHAKDLSDHQAHNAANQANAMLHAGVDEGTAIATAIKRAKKEPRHD